MSRAIHTTWTYLVEEALRRADDFISVAELRARTGANPNQLSATLHHLQKCGVVDAVVAQGTLFWFYAGGDTRTYSLEVRADEERPRRPRHSRSKKELASK